MFISDLTVRMKFSFIIPKINISLAQFAAYYAMTGLVHLHNWAFFRDPSAYTRHVLDVD